MTKGTRMRGTLTLALALVASAAHADPAKVAKDWNRLVITPLESLAAHARALAAGDVNGDGKDDLIFAGELKGQLGLYVALSKGDGTFEPWKDLELAHAAGAIAVGQFHKGKGLDIVTIFNVGNGPDDGGLYLNKGAGKFAGGKSFTPVCNPGGAGAAGMVVTGALAADLNGDGVSDLICRAGHVAVAMGSATGAFRGWTEVKNVNPSAGIALADMDGDGALDLIAVSQPRNPKDDESKVCVSFNHHGALDDEPRCFTMSLGTWGLFNNGISAGDLNGDGKPDVAVGFRNNHGIYIDLMMNDGKGGLEEPTKVKIADSGEGLFGITIVDINGDKKPDVIAFHEDAVLLFPGNGDGTLGKRIKVPMGHLMNRNDGNALVVGDFRGNGTKGIAMFHQTPTGDDSIDVVSFTLR
jgi:hypothetical protein